MCPCGRLLKLHALTRGGGGGGGGGGTYLCALVATYFNTTSLLLYLPVQCTGLFPHNSQLRVTVKLLKIELCM